MPVLESALARATIHLNLRNLQAAAQAALEAIEADPDFLVLMPYVGFGKPAISGHRFMPEGQAFYSPAHGLLLVSRDTWHDHIMNMGIHRFALTVAAEHPEPAWIPYRASDFFHHDDIRPGLREQLDGEWGDGW
ncbi:hypothetical protein Kisp02_62660 [Kineosporia sp. NBRC 101731]|nr:hypothetical protein Kisp02_62660 [Kineosporia sp. NBRC 101731]